MKRMRMSGDNQLNKTISAQTELIQSLQKTLEADRLEKENLRQQMEYLTKKLFGTCSEKRKDIDGQLNLFDEAEQEADPTWEQELPDDITVPEHKRKARRTHADLFKNVPSCDEIISLPEEERNCPTCGTQMECIGKEFVRHEFRFTPAKGKVKCSVDMSFLSLSNGTSESLGYSSRTCA